MQDAVLRDDAEAVDDEDSDHPLPAAPLEGKDAEHIHQVPNAPNAVPHSELPPFRPPSPLTASTSPPSHQLSAKERKILKQKVKGHENRSKKRKATHEDSFSHHAPRPKVRAKYVQDSHALHSSAVMEDARVASTGYVGLPDRVRDTKIYSLDDLVGPNSKFKFRLVPYTKGTPIPIVSGDEDERIIGVIADAPPDKDWTKLANDAAELLEDARLRCTIPHGETQHRRGNFATLRCGVSHGNGQTEPKNLSNRPTEAEVARELNGKEPFIRLAGYATSVMAAWAPGLYGHYIDKVGGLHAEYPHLQRNFPTSGSVFTATTYNLGPQTTCLRHTDCLNLPYGWCAITALGNFNYKTGGHLILWEAQLVIEFPPGTTILIPSAAISHSNVRVSPAERRYSFTQYTAGGIFRWVNNGFRKSSVFWDSLDDNEKVKETEKSQNRWKEGLGLWMKMSDLRKSV